MHLAYYCHLIHHETGIDHPKIFSIVHRKIFSVLRFMVFRLQINKGENKVNEPVQKLFPLVIFMFLNNVSFL